MLTIFFIATTMTKSVNPERFKYKSITFFYFLQEIPKIAPVQIDTQLKFGLSRFFKTIGFMGIESLGEKNNFPVRRTENTDDPAKICSFIECSLSGMHTNEVGYLWFCF